MDSIIESRESKLIEAMLSLTNKTPNLELECKVFPSRRSEGGIDRVKFNKLFARLKEIIPNYKSEVYMNITTADNLRITIPNSSNILKAAQQNNLADIPYTIIEKRSYLDHLMKDKGNTSESPINIDTLDLKEANIRFTVRVELPHEKKFHDIPEGAYVRMIQRYTFELPSQSWRYDLSVVRSGVYSGSLIPIIKKANVGYELEMEYTKSNTKMESEIMKDYANLESSLMPLMQVEQGTYHILPFSSIKGYVEEFKHLNPVFINVTSFERTHLNPDNRINIWSGYTVTEKADGERYMLFVTKDLKVVMINKSKSILMWTGWTMTEKKYAETIIDGEYLENLNLYKIFDVLYFCGKDVRSLPLFVGEDEEESRTKYRLGLCGMFAEAPMIAQLGYPVPRIEVKDFIWAEGKEIFKAVKTILNTDYGYHIDGIIFTPVSDGYGTNSKDMEGSTWEKLLKWKPSTDLSIDFLVKAAIDPATKNQFKGIKGGKQYVLANLFVGSRGDEIIHPCLQMTEEYKPPKHTGEYINVRFQPQNPEKLNAYECYLYPYEDGNIYTINPREKIDLNSNQIVEFTYDVDNEEWIPLRIRHDKKDFGNSFKNAQTIWTSMHFPVTPEMITTGENLPMEEESYYKEGMRTSKEINAMTYFHKQVKDLLYKIALSGKSKTKTLLELGVGRAGDLPRWVKYQPKLVVGVDVDSGGIENSSDGACTRVIKSRLNKIDVPPSLFLVGDTGKNLFEEDTYTTARSKTYSKLLLGSHPPAVDYLKQFEGLFKSGFDVISIQFAIHYFFENSETLDTFIRNLDKLSKGDTMFIGTTLDGASLYGELMKDPTIRIVDSTGNTNIEVVREFDPTVTPWTGDEMSLGLPIEVYYDSFNQRMKEYLVPWEVLKMKMLGIGFEVVETALFKDVHIESQAGVPFSHQRISFLHRMFVFQRKSEESHKEEKPKKESKEPKEKISEIMKEVIEKTTEEDEAVIVEGTSDKPAEVVSEKPIVKISVDGAEVIVGDSSEVVKDTVKATINEPEIEKPKKKIIRKKKVEE